MPKGTCPECEGEVQVESNASTSDILSCEECGSDLEIVGLDPLEFEVFEETYDEDEDDDEY